MWRNKSVGGWRCSVRTKTRQHRDQSTTDYYVKRRRRDLRSLKERLLEQLTNLRKENP